MNLGLKLSLATAGGGQRMDADAAAYIEALVSSGATVSSVQSSAIDTFIRAEKSGERWDLIKRMYLPIWGIVAPNAICMRSLTSGTFVNSPTMASGYVQGNGTTQYFDMGATYAAMGCTSNSVSVFGGRLAVGAGTGAKSIVGTRESTNNIMSLEVIGDGGVFENTRVMGLTTATLGTGNGTNNNVGFLMGSVDATTRRLFSLRNSGIRSWDNARTGGVIDTVTNVNAMRRNWASPDQYDEGRLISFGVGLAVTDAQGRAFLANLKTLWETCTGLSLPA